MEIRSFTIYSRKKFYYKQYILILILLSLWLELYKMHKWEDWRPSLKKNKVKSQEHNLDMKH